MLRMPTTGSTRSDDEQRNKKTYACVKWLSGAYKDSITHDVDLEWIVDFDARNLEESYVIEWRVSPKPRTGWKVFDGLVLEVSGK